MFQGSEYGTAAYARVTQSSEYQNVRVQNVSIMPDYMPRYALMAVNMTDHGRTHVFL